MYDRRRRTCYRTQVNAHSEILDAGPPSCILARFVSQTTPLRLVLTATKDIADQAVTAEKAMLGRRERVAA
jgi:hypothetical protein